MTVDVCYQLMLSIMRKNQAGGLSAVLFQQFFNAEQTAYQSDLLGRWQARSNGKTGMSTGLIENETILTKLTPFTENNGLTVIAGKAVKAVDFVYTLAMRINNMQVQALPKSQLAAMLTSVIDPPSTEDNCYYYTEYRDYYSFFPDSISLADVDYIRRPVDVIWGFTYDANDRQQYDPGTSIDPEWMEADCVEIVRRCLKTLGVSFKDADFTNYGNSVIQTGD